MDIFLTKMHHFDLLRYLGLCRLLLWWIIMDGCTFCASKTHILL